VVTFEKTALEDNIEPMVEVLVVKFVDTRLLIVDAVLTILVTFMVGLTRLFVTILLQVMFPATTEDMLEF
jgi:hypothetical protein